MVDARLRSAADGIPADAGFLTLQLPDCTPRAVFLSGMNGPEVNEVISAYHDSGMHLLTALPPLCLPG